MAIISETTSLVWQHLLVILTVLVVFHFVRNYFNPGVSDLPSPFWAKISNVWRFIDVARGRAQETHLRLHEKYGPYVRLGSNLVSVCNLDVLKSVYGVNQGYTKTSFYEVQQQLANGKPTQTLFTTLDEDLHAKIKRPISSAYSMSSLTEFEVFVDKTIRIMMEKLDGFAEDDRSGQIPWLDYLFIKNPVRRMLGGGSTGAVARFARECLVERLMHPNRGKSDGSAHRDFLTRFLEAKERHPNVVTDAQVFSYTLSNVNTGSDTTAISLRAVLHLTLKHPRVLEKLCKELQDAQKAGKLSIPAMWKETQELPYLDAVIKEALRLHPAVGLLLERIVPKGDLQLANGPMLPAGTVVGVNPWVIHHYPLFREDTNLIYSGTL
ncbi:cytochrome P450 [Dactylonectria estremocensis]|uniref:Cytochrome P450 n=1 Tax=Dactylonectria estremocensis TaxID=1079267 RepID=A0A9P9IB02_9HYPO|nr:cytochrome P450 [Dactylonectria estremocensis]